MPTPSAPADQSAGSRFSHLTRRWPRPAARHFGRRVLTLTALLSALASLLLWPGMPMRAQTILLPATARTCVPLKTIQGPLEWTWTTGETPAEPSSSVDSPGQPSPAGPAAIVTADSVLAISLSSSTAVTGAPSPAATASPATTPPAANGTTPSPGTSTVSGTSTAPAPVTATSATTLPRTSEPRLLCASWEPEGQTPPSFHPFKLTLLNETADQARLQLRFGEALPLGLRTALRVSLQTSSPASADSIVVSPPESTTVLASTRWLCALISTLFVFVIYLFLSTVIHAFYCPKSKFLKSIKSSGLRILDPAVISAGDYGAASLANLQILWFTLIVTWLISNGWLLTGQLVSPSTSLLGLLGISGTVNVIGKTISQNQQRISLDHWNWLVENQFLKRDCDIDPFKVAQWRDLVISGGVLEPSRYQLLIFGFLIGITMLVGDPLEIGTYKVPDFFLFLQGVSGSLYLFGKAISPTARQEFEDQLTALRKPGSEPLQPETLKAMARTIESLYGKQALGKAFTSLEPTAAGI